MATFKKITSDFLKSNSRLIARLEDRSDKISEICGKIDRAWSGFPFGDNAFYYYQDFLIPPAGSSWNVEWGTINGIPRGWIYLRGDEVKNKIQDSIGKDFTIKQYNKEGEALLSSINSFKNAILVQFSDIEFNEKMEKEKKLYEEIELYNFGDRNELGINYIEGSRAAGKFTSRDFESLAKGRIVPSHIVIAASAHATQEVIGNINRFIDLVERFEKQINKKMSSLSVNKKKELPKNANEKLQNILNKFHRTAQQIKIRHSNRPTIEINDEYDVQDLLQSILNIEFDDIRPEEHTPSYGGSSTRMDFLLKKEQIVIEVKIASDKLKEKEIGEQLILDIAHYKEHQDCKTLYCFIYDPKSILTKKSNLINDLEKKYDGLEVKIVIRPSD